MSSLTENIYEIKDLYVVSLKNEIATKKGSEYLELFNPDLLFVVEKFVIKKNEGLPYFFQAYTECITGRDIYIQESNEEIREFPDVFESIEEFNIDYLNEEERQTGTITTSRIFQIFQEINIKSEKIKKRGSNGEYY